MSLDEARTRADALARQRAGETEAPPTHAHPLPPTEEPPAPVAEPPAESVEAAPPVEAEAPTEEAPTEEAPVEEATVEDNADEPSPAEAEAPENKSVEDQLSGGAIEQESANEADAPAPSEDAAASEVSRPEPEAAIEPAPTAAETFADEGAIAPTSEPEQREESLSANEAFGEAPVEEAPAAPPPQAAEPPTPAAPPSAEPPEDWQPKVARRRSDPDAAAATASAPADATAFAPKKLRRGTPELVRIVVHQPKDLQAVIKAAKQLDPRTDPAPHGMPIGDVALGASISVSLDVRGAACDGVLQRRTWAGEPIDFSFSADAEDGVKQVVFLARVFVNDAQIGVLAFTRNVSGPNKKPHGAGDRVRLKRHKRVFLSYSSTDRETVSQIATAYQSAGVDHFWDRASLKSGEEWHPRLRREIDRADLFHVCWSRAAAQSEWVKKETEHALTRRRRHSGKPDITVQMLDGPPWAPHPPELDAINFDDFVRAAIVGYARGDGSQD
jgi:hypothetical protein